MSSFSAKSPVKIWLTGYRFTAAAAAVASLLTVRRRPLVVPFVECGAEGMLVGEATVEESNPNRALKSIGPEAAPKNTLKPFVVAGLVTALSLAYSSKF